LDVVQCVVVVKVVRGYSGGNSGGSGKGRLYGAEVKLFINGRRPGWDEWMD
jgi:hypothetical protein